ncbi:trypsin-like serine peptidase [Amycolatopsis sp. NPDC059657]|uniref:trypsin-like serine peptidase n=1 Tax=Amycolatopsis sp. NPDC059657 TaxID=3346899 RepID=UPI00366E3481
MNILLRASAAVGAACLGLALFAPAAGATGTGLAGVLKIGGCSGSLIRLPDSAPGDRALALTNGHCYEGAKPVADEVLVNRPSERLAALLDDKGGTVATLQATKALYVTMTGTDMALYELKQTYRQIEAEHGARPFTITTGRPAVGTAIRIVSGGLKKVYECDIDRLVYRVLETGNVTKDVIRYTQACDTGPGSSGSPMLDRTSGELVGLNNTSNRAGEQCTVNNPCEMDRDGVITVHKGRGYGTQVYWLTTCFDGHSRLNLAKKGCLLPKPA